MPDIEFPEYSEKPPQTWVEKLPDRLKEDYRKARQHDIDKDTKVIENIIRSVDDFKGEPDEAIAYLSLRLATSMRNGFEEGIQVGFDASSQQLQAEQERFSSFQIASLGGYG